MPQVIPGTRALPVAQKGFREGFKAILRPAAEQIGTVLQRYAGIDGKIDPKRERQVLAATGQIIDRVFVGFDGRHAYAEDEATPLSPYAKLMNTWVAYITVKAVRNQQAWMKRNVPEDVYNWLSRAKRPTGVREIDVSARMGKGFVPNAFAKYDPLHLWVDPNGYRLSDRIWRTDGDMRARLDAMIAEQIRNGNSAFNISKKAEQFMLPGRAALRTDKPYGKDASYRGMVLGRTEITHAHGEVTLTTARLNPYVTGMDWVLSASHPKNDPCDVVATVGPGGGRLREPYPMDNVPSYPMHPQCVLPGQMVTTVDGDVPIEDIQSGDLVLTHEGRYQPVQSSWHNNYEGVIYRIETANGSMEITPEHPVMTLRGWINAEDLQSTDYILDTSFDIGFDCSFGVMENCPAQFPKACVPQSVFLFGMPVNTITFDSDFRGNQSEVQPETFNPILSSKVEPVFGQHFTHSLLDSGFPLVGVEALHATEATGSGITSFDLETLLAVETSHESSILQTHGMHDDMREAGVVDLFGSGNLSANTGFSSRVSVTSLQCAEPFDSLPLRLAKSAIILNPLQLSCFALGTQRNSAVSEELNQHSELSAEDAIDLRCAEQVGDIELGQDIFKRTALLGFDPLDMSTDGVEPHAVAAAFPSAGLTANRTITGVVSTHDNLLSSSPECEEGAASGNAVVERLITPPQAQLHYIKIQSISVREYAGLVYNMHVEVDNSYTVNGMAVHNCLCNIQSVVTATPAQVTEELRGFMQEGEEPPLTPAADDTLLWLLLGAAFYEWWTRNGEEVAG